MNYSWGRKHTHVKANSRSYTILFSVDEMERHQCWLKLKFLGRMDIGLSKIGNYNICHKGLIT
jgi:hypothetical protein